MKRWVSYSGVPKQEMHVSVPIELAQAFKLHAQKEGLRPTELMTYVLCHILSRDPRDFGLHPMSEVGQNAGGEPQDSDSSLDHQ